MTKEHVGAVTNYYRQASVVEIDIRDHGFFLGDELLIQGSTTGSISFTVEEIRQDELSVREASRGIATVQLAQRVRTNDKVFRRIPRPPN